MLGKRNACGVCLAAEKWQHLKFLGLHVPHKKHWWQIWKQGGQLRWTDQKHMEYQTSENQYIYTIYIHIYIYSYIYSYEVLNFFHCLGLCMAMRSCGAGHWPFIQEPLGGPMQSSSRQWVPQHSKPALWSAHNFEEAPAPNWLHWRNLSGRSGPLSFLVHPSEDNR